MWKVRLDLGCCSFKICDFSTTPSLNPPNQVLAYLRDEVAGTRSDPRKIYKPNKFLGIGLLRFTTELLQPFGKCVELVTS